MKNKGILSMLTLEELREFYSKAVKYLLDENDWDCDALRIVKEEFQNSNSIKDLKLNFERFHSILMKENSDLTSLMKDFIGNDIKLKRRSIRRRKKRLKQKQREIHQLIFRSNASKKKPAKGILLFTNSVKTQFLGRRRM